MGDRVGGVDEEVIHVDDKPSFCNHIVKGIIHKVLEGGRGISETKEHYGWLEESFVDDESGFPLMSVLDSDIVVSPLDVKFGEDFHSLEFVDEVRNEWKGICITDCVFIDIAVILARTKATIFLFNEEEGGCLWGIRGADFASS